MLVHAKRRVAGISPTAAITYAGSAALPHCGLFGARVQDRFDGRIPVAAVSGSMRAVADRILEVQIESEWCPFRTGSIITQEEDQGVVQVAVGAEIVDH